MKPRTGADIKTYRAWVDMRQRCNNPKSQRYPRYGGRGITYSPRWVSYDCFVAAIGNAPPGTSLERKDNDGPYNKDNCIWATAAIQASNKGMLKNNKSGLKGVFFDEENNIWRAYGAVDNTREWLYRGYSLFDACCARKSWEAKHHVEETVRT
jgi:hypothetical protein